MSKIVYDTGDMLMTARNMENAMKSFTDKKKKAKKTVNDSKKHNNDPKTRYYAEQYENFDKDVIEKLEKNMQGYVCAVRTAAKRVADTVKGINI